MSKSTLALITGLFLVGVTAWAGPGLWKSSHQDEGSCCGLVSVPGTSSCCSISAPVDDEATGSCCAQGKSALLAKAKTDCCGKGEPCCELGLPCCEEGVCCEEGGCCTTTVGFKAKSDCCGANKECCLFDLPCCKGEASTVGISAKSECCAVKAKVSAPCCESAKVKGETTAAKPAQK